jgi:hypothetical protein
MLKNFVIENPTKSKVKFVRKFRVHIGIVGKPLMRVEVIL